MTNASPPRRQTARPWLLMLAGPVIGLVHFLVVYLGAEAACAGSDDDADVSRLRVVIVISTILAVAISVAAAWSSAALYREDDRVARDTAEQRRFVGATALILTALFVYFIAMVVGPVIGAELC